jgi:hypothetical protein
VEWDGWQVVITHRHVGLGVLAGQTLSVHMNNIFVHIKFPRNQIGPELALELSAREVQDTTVRNQVLMPSTI